MEEKKYCSCPECGAPCEIIERSYKEEIHDVHYVEHKYHPQPGAVWVKASERLPGLKKPVKWREDGRELKMQEVWYMILDSNTRELERCEWYDESAPESPAEQPVAYDLAKVFQWAAEYDNENEQLVLSEDGQWLLLKTEGGVTETEELSNDDLAELYRLHNPATAPEQPVRDVETMEFAEWCGTLYRLTKEGWYDDDGYYNSTEQLLKDFRKQKQPPAEWSGEKEGTK